MAIGQLNRGNSTEPMHEINVTPLVDVMLVLLIIFIVTAPLLTHKVKLNLPKVTTQASSVQNPMVVSLTRDEFLYLDGQPISGEELDNALRTSLAQGIEPTVELRADGELDYQHVVRIMALIQNAGVTKLSFLTSPTPGVADLSFPQQTAPASPTTPPDRSSNSQQPIGASP